MKTYGKASMLSYYTEMTTRPGTPAQARTHAFFKKAVRKTQRRQSRDELRRGLAAVEAEVTELRKNAALLAKAASEHEAIRRRNQMHVVPTSSDVVGVRRVPVTHKAAWNPETGEWAKTRKILLVA